MVADTGMHTCLSLMLGDAGADFFFLFEMEFKWKLEAASERAFARRRHRHRFRVGLLTAAQYDASTVVAPNWRWGYLDLRMAGKDLFAKPRPGAMAA